MSNEVQHLLNHIQYKTKKTLDEIAKEIGYTRPYLNKVKLKGVDSGKIIGILKSKYANELRDVPRFTQGHKAIEQEKEGERVAQTTSNQVDSNFLPENISAADVIRALINLSESNKSLADNNRIALDSNRMAIETNKTIADTNSALAKRLMEKDSTVDSHSGMQTDALATLLAVREQVIELVADVKNTTLDEAESVLGIKAVAAKKKLDKMGSVADVGKERNQKR